MKKLFVLFAIAGLFVACAPKGETTEAATLEPATVTDSVVAPADSVVVDSVAAVVAE